MSTNRNSRSLALAKLIASIVAAGALVAGLMLPWVGGTGLVARNSANLLDALPVELTDQIPNGNTRVLAADGSLLTEFYSNNRQPVSSEQIAPVMKQALVDIEDTRFEQHNGLDVQGTLRALAKNVAAGEVAEGGSTLTQQLVKQTLLQTAETPEEAAAANAETVGRKLREARLALALEEKYSKDEILTRYLNIVYFGHSAYGIQAAARTYFSVDAKDLTLAQASVLAGLVQSPGQDDPLVNPEKATERRNQVLARMHTLGHITDQELADVSAAPIPVAEGPKPPNGCANAALGAYFCDYLQTYLVQNLGITKTQLENSGWTIQTTIDPQLQTLGDAAVLETVPMSGGNDLAGVFTAVEPGTGHVKAMSVNRRYGCTEYECESVNLNVVPTAGAGSTFKVFVAAAALIEGFGSNYTITTSSPYTSKVFKKNGGTRGAPYVISNASQNYPGTLTMTDALVRSSNTYFVALMDALGSVEKPVRTAEAMGMHFDGANQVPAQTIIDGERGSFTLGPDATSPLDLASAYSTLAANGTRCEPTPVTAITDAAGNPALKPDGTPYVAGDACTPEAVPANVAKTMNQMMIGDTASPAGTATRAAVPGHQVAGKTGTTQGNVSTTFIGSTPQVTASVMVFNPKSARNVGGFGGNKPATIWHDAMAPYLADKPAVPFAQADASTQRGTRPTVPSCSSVTSCATAIQNAGFGSSVQAVRSDQPAGTFLGTSPAAGSPVTPGQRITIQTSDGSGYSEPTTAEPGSETAEPGTGTLPDGGAPEVDTNGDGIPD
ncbi:penicillin-binding protein [Modestobacter sp. I12A-02628]|uniref:Penicillin-binding protein n=1 Tax=Goekera deserti TaxID=2497753 RepID=A0A7K3WEK3_9ACTN|nr:penicillin-binding protein [Goekera deserti]MPQ98043.1 penicillin-binding protein [Goekera deserti]NDI48690.1 penicillin-binding protein [Goekera deserti]NEL54931.1 penicillin-binding protein [Goekera deserti]